MSQVTGPENSPPKRCATLVRNVAVEAITPDPRNARQHPARQVAQIAKSIESFGFNVPLLLDGSGCLIAGHGRLLAAKQLGWREVPTITLEHLSPDQVKALSHRR